MLTSPVMVWTGASRPAVQSLGTRQEEPRMPNVKLDHCVIHVSDWERSNTYYRDVLGAELVPRESGWSYRFGDEQLNLHGPGVSPAPVDRKSTRLNSSHTV